MENIERYLYNFKIGNITGLADITFTASKNGLIEFSLYSGSNIPVEKQKNFNEVVRMIQIKCDQFETSSEIKENWIWESAE